MVQPTVEQRLRVLMVVHAGLVMGVVIFAIIVLVLQRPATLTGNALLIMRISCVAVLAAAVVLSTVLRRAAIQRLAIRPAPPPIVDVMQAFSAFSLIKAALAEGAAILAALIFLLSADPWDLLLIGAGLAVLAAMIPSPNKWQAFVDDVQAERDRSDF